MSELMCPFLPRDSWHNEFEGPCVVVVGKGDHCEVYQQLAERDNRIAGLEAERDRLREALRKIAEMEAGSHEPSFEMRGCMTSESCMNCDEMINIAREALEGAGE